MANQASVPLSSPLVSVVIPIFNQWRYTAACLDSLHRTLPNEFGVEVIVVDNASTDESAAGLTEWQARWAPLRVERLPTNTGFSPACNRGAELARGKYLVFLNNDTEPLEEWLPPLIAEVEKAGVGIAAPKLLYPQSRTINHAGYVFARGSFYGIYHDRPADLPGANKPRTYQALLGACIIIRRDVFESLGRFSLDGLEDIDLCLKARERGLVSRYVPSSVVLHHGSVTLELSPPGSFPVTDRAGFGQRWGAHPITWDDFLWYIEDGEWPAPRGASDLESAKRTANSSVDSFIAAVGRLNAGDRVGGIALLRESLDLWAHNPWSFAQLCVSLTEIDRRGDALDLLQRLGEFSFTALVLDAIEPALKVLLPNDHARLWPRK